MGFLEFQAIVTIALFFLQYRLFLSIRRRFLTHERFRRYLPLIALPFVAFTAPLTITLLFRALGKGLPNWYLYYVMYPVYLWQFISLIVATLILTGKVVKIPIYALERLLGRFQRTGRAVDKLRSNDTFQKFDAGRRMVIRQSFAFIAGSAALGSAYEMYRSGTFEKSDIRLQIKGLPESFHGFSIGFISDVHSGIFMSGERMRTYAEAVNALGCDMIVVTGDFVNLHLDEVYPFKEAFGVLSAPFGVYGVLGNHDYYTRQVDEVAREVERSGISLLRNRFDTINRNGESIILAGIDDTGNPEVAERGFRQVSGPARADIPRILLCHRPYFFREAAASGFDLVLSGHTHGGQVVLGEIGRDVLAPARLFSPYVSGLYAEGGSQMYVSRGLGVVSIPIRFNCPPEITKIVLEKPDMVASQAL